MEVSVTKIFGARTSSESASTVLTLIFMLSQGRTTLVIAHRLSTIRHSDQIGEYGTRTIQDALVHRTDWKSHHTFSQLYPLRRT